MTNRQSDLERARAAFSQMLDGAVQLEHAASAIGGRVQEFAERFADPGVAERVVRAGVGAALDAAAGELARPRAAPRERAANVLPCPGHGENAWEQTIGCTACGRVFQLLNPSAPRFASEVCPCGEQLLPAPGKRSRAAPICTPCYREISAAGGRAVWRPR